MEQIEHRLFSFISQNWRGKPLLSHQVVVNLIGATTTRTGLKVYARLDPRAACGGRAQWRRFPSRVELQDQTARLKIYEP